MRDSTQSLRLSPLFLVLASLFITSLISANIIAVKLFSVAGELLPAGVIIFPLSYILGDVLTEVYGYRYTRLVIWLGFLCNLVAVLAFWGGGLLPPAPFPESTELESAYERVLGYTPRLLAASFFAYLVGEFTNSAILARVKVVTNGRWLWTRTIGSTLVGQGVDSLIFITLAFGGTLPLESLFRIVLVQWLAKVTYEVLATPLTYLVVGYIKRTERLDTYDRNVSFNPVALFR
ncbi:MAG: queuosine precursor transporter [Chloroflexi bacterium]|nr:queuosine precursor transporter [Chloroflexota bacterium]